MNALAGKFVFVIVVALQSSFAGIDFYGDVSSGSVRSGSEVRACPFKLFYAHEII